MTRRLVSLATILAAAIYAVCVADHFPAVRADSAPAMASRAFEFTYKVHFPATEHPGGLVLLWIPLPQADGYQDVSVLHIDSPAAYSAGRDSEYKNRFAMFKPTAKQCATGFDVTLCFTATRREHKVALDGMLKNASVSSTAGPLHRYLEPDELIPLNGTIAELAKEHTAGDTTQIEKARHIYEYVVSTIALR